MNPELNIESRPERTYQERINEFLVSRRGKMFGVVEVVRNIDEPKDTADTP